MSTITDAQNEAIDNANADSAGYLTVYGAAAGSESTITVTSTTPFQISTSRDAFLYLSIQTAAAVTITMGPEAAGTSVGIAVSAVEAIGLATIYVPVGWYVVLTGTTADFTAKAVLK